MSARVVCLNVDVASRRAHTRTNSGRAYGASAETTCVRNAAGSNEAHVVIAAIPARPSTPGTGTPYTAAPVTPGIRQRAPATSVVATFSPFHRKVSPIRSTK
jgi:hypothetical protein